MRWAHAVVAACFVAAASANALQFRGGLLDTSVVPSLSLSHHADGVSLENVLPRTLSLPSASASLTAGKVEKSRQSASAEDIYIVQLDSDYVTTFSDRHASSIVGYVPQNAFLVRASLGDATRLQQERGVRWLNVLPAEHRITPRLRELLEAGAPRGDSMNTASADARVASSNEFASLFVTSEFDVTADVYASAVASRRSMATLSAEGEPAVADTDKAENKDAGEEASFAEVAGVTRRSPRPSSSSSSSSFPSSSKPAPDSPEARRARFAASLASAPGASVSPAGLPQHTLTAMISAPLDLPAALTGVRGGVSDAHAAAARATAEGIEGVLSGPSFATQDASMKVLAEDDLRVLKLTSTAPIVAALRRALPPVPPTAAAAMKVASVDGTNAADAANAAAGAVPSDYSPLFPLSADLDTVSPSVLAAPRDNAGNFESVSSIAFTFQSPLFAVPAPLDGTADVAEGEVIKAAPEDVSALVAEAAFNVAGEAARAGAAPFAALSTNRDAVSARATGSDTPLARHIAAVTRAIALASAEGHVAEAAVDETESGKSGKKNGFATLASSGEYHRALARATASVLSLQTRWVGAAVAAAVGRLTESPDVLLVDVVPQYQPLNKRARWVVTTFNDPVPLNAPGFENQMTPFHAVGITGVGHIVGVADSGIDARSCYFLDAVTSVPFGTTPNLRHRKIVQYVDYMDRTDLEGGHGTHVVGTITGASIPTGTLPSKTEHDGIAPGAKIAFFDLERARSSRDSIFAVPNNIDEMLSPAYNAGARIHSNSWGCYNSFDQRPSDLCNEYSTSDYYFDRFMKRRNNFLAIIAAGNDGAYAHRTVGSPATAKNVLTIGAASQSLLSAKETVGSHDEYLEHPDYYSIKSLASFSSTGPTRDGRMKPDVTAPGDALVSARASTSSVSGKISCDSHSMSGTSMATPVVSGSALLVRDYLQKGFLAGKGQATPNKGIADPAGSLIKAILINSGQDLTHRQGAGGMQAVPLFRQTKISRQINRREHFPMGRLFSISGSTSTKMYIKPSTSAATNITILVERTGSSTDWTLELRGPGFPDNSASGTDTLPSIEFSREIMMMQKLTLPAGSQYALDLTVTSASSRYPLYIGILEYEADVPVRSRPITCAHTFSALPAFKFGEASDSIEEASWSVTCPTPSTCQRSSDVVHGVSMYSSVSSICRAAIHTGSINVTDSSPQAVMPSPILFRGPGTRSLAGSTRNGVTSRGGHITAGEYVYMPNFGGAPEEEYPSVLPVPASLNTLTGHGAVDLAAVLPLADPSRSESDNATSVRQLVVLSDGTETITHRSWRTRCFLVSHLPEQETGYSSENIDFTFSVGPSRVKVTLAWPDFAQTVNVYPSIVNDVDLHVFGPRGEEWRGNDAADRLNSVEQVWLRSFQSGLYCATTHGHQIPIGAQAYSVVASGPGVEECPAAPAAAIPLTGTYKVSGVKCDEGLSDADVAAVFTNGAEWGAIQAGTCFSLRDAPVNAAGATAQDFNGLRRSTTGATRGHYAPVATVAAAGTFSATAAGQSAVLAGTDRFAYHVQLKSADSQTGKAVLAVTVAQPGSDAGCHATLTATAAATADVQGEVVEPARHDKEEPPMNGAAGPAALGVAFIAVVVAVATLLF